MNKDDLIGKVASSVGLSKTDAAKSVDAVFSNINAAEIYEYYFKLMPIAYTWGKDHRMKVLKGVSRVVTIRNE